MHAVSLRPLPRQVGDLVAQDAEQVRLEGAHLGEPAEALQETEKRLLHGIFRRQARSGESLRCISGEPSGEPVHELAERIPVPLCDRGDEVPVAFAF